MHESEKKTLLWINKEIRRFNSEEFGKTQDSPQRTMKLHDLVSTIGLLTDMELHPDKWKSHD